MQKATQFGKSEWLIDRLEKQPVGTPLMLTELKARPGRKNKILDGYSLKYSIAEKVRSHFAKRQLRIRTHCTKNGVVLTLVHGRKGKLKRLSPKSQPLTDRAHRCPFDLPFFVDHHMAGTRAYASGHGTFRQVPIHLNTVARKLRQSRGYRVLSWVPADGGYHVTKHSK
jgi:hypothetical protein